MHRVDLAHLTGLVYETNHHHRLDDKHDNLDQTYFDYLKISGFYDNQWGMSRHIALSQDQ